jgi:hypothetical protein
LAEEKREAKKEAIRQENERIQSKLKKKKKGCCSCIIPGKNFRLMVVAGCVIAAGMGIYLGKFEVDASAYAKPAKASSVWLSLSAFLELLMHTFLL